MCARTYSFPNFCVQYVHSDEIIKIITINLTLSPFVAYGQF